MSDTIKDYLNSFIGIAILLVPLVKEWRKSAKRSKMYIVFLLFSCVGLLYLGIDKINRDNRKEVENTKRQDNYEKEINSLDNNVFLLSSGRKMDSLAFKQFTSSLEEKFHIIRDSNNVPRLVNYNTHINKAETVNIGR